MPHRRTAKWAGRIVEATAEAIPSPGSAPARRPACRIIDGQLQGAGGIRLVRPRVGHTIDRHLGGRPDGIQRTIDDTGRASLILNLCSTPSHSHTRI
ncbi:hypothetical protein FQZ97_749300 [compost metagenome]